ncbi:MAG: glycosyl hydrolase [Sedimentisphaerales bacterium]
MKLFNKGTHRQICVLLFLASFVFASITRADDLYDSFKNPPAAARPVVHWDWPAKLPADKEIIKQLETFKNSGFGGVEITPAEITLTAAKSLKFAADEAKKRDMLVDLVLPWPPTAPSLQPDECAKTISLDKKFLKGPIQFHTDINDLNSKLKTQNSKLMFLRLIPLDQKQFDPGDEFINKIQPNGDADFNIPDGNYVFYTGILNFTRRSDREGGQQSAIDPLNKRAVEKYFNNLSAALAPAFGGNLGDTLHAISFDLVIASDLSSVAIAKGEAKQSQFLAGANWTSDFEQEFVKRRGYDLIACLPVILDDDIADDKTYFYQTVRRTRYDFYKTLAELLNERFLTAFNDFCRGNGVLARLELPENPLSPGFSDANLPFDIPQSKIAHNPQAWNLIASSAAHFADKPLTCCRFSDDPCFFENQQDSFRIHDLAFVSGINQFICTERNSGPKSRIDRNARLSAVFRNSQLNLNPVVKISPANPNLFFINYFTSDRDIFFFTNVDRTSSLSFNAQFETGDKIPWLWDPETGNRNLFHYGSSKNSLDIEFDPLDSVLLVFEPDMSDKNVVEK